MFPFNKVVSETDSSRKYFPPAKFQSQSQSDSESSPPPEILALPDPPTAEPTLRQPGQPEAKKQKVNRADSEQSHKTGEKSEDDWEEVDRSEGGPVESLDEEPVEVGKSSAADVHSVQSSGIIDSNESTTADNLLLKDW